MKGNNAGAGGKAYQSYDVQNGNFNLGVLNQWYYLVATAGRGTGPAAINNTNAYANPNSKYKVSLFIAFSAADTFEIRFLVELNGVWVQVDGDDVTEVVGAGGVTKHYIVEGYRGVRVDIRCTTSNASSVDYDYTTDEAPTS